MYRCEWRGDNMINKIIRKLKGYYEDEVLDKYVADINYMNKLIASIEKKEKSFMNRFNNVDNNYISDAEINKHQHDLEYDKHMLSVTRERLKETKLDAEQQEYVRTHVIASNIASNTEGVQLCQ